MKVWAVQDAKARFSELLATCLKHGPQLVTKHGVDTAVLVPAEEWRRMNQAARQSLKELLLSSRSRADIPIPVRGGKHRRQVSRAD